LSSIKAEITSSFLFDVLYFSINLLICFVYNAFQPRLLMAMARDGLLPPFFSDINKHSHVPVKSTIVTGLVPATLAFFMDVSQLAGLVGLIINLYFQLLGSLCFVCQDYEFQNVAKNKKQLNPTLGELADSGFNCFFRTVWSGFKNVDL
jgi:amino acid transporter